MVSLSGKRIVVTRPKHQSVALAALIEARGGESICIPVIEIAPMDDYTELDQELSRIDSYDWLIWTSVNGVAAVWDRFESLGIYPNFENVCVAAIGPKTAAALEARGVLPDFIPEQFVAEAILPGLGDVRGLRVLLLRADIARAALVESIRAGGGIARDIPVYQTLPAQPEPGVWEEFRAGVEIIIFTSSSTVINFKRMVQEQGYGVEALPGDPLIACIGPITAATAAECGFDVAVVPQAYTIEGLIQALERRLHGDEEHSA
jgi:uroporphyrinogen-III synthase